MEHIRDFIGEIIDSNQLSTNEVERNNLITQSLYLFFKNRYFNETYSNILILEDEEKNMFLSTGKMDSNEKSFLITSASKNEDYESQFVELDKCVKILDATWIDKIKKVYNAFKLPSTKKTIAALKKIGELDDDSLFIFESVYSESLHWEASDYYYNIMEQVELNNTYSEKFNIQLPCKENGKISISKSNNKNISKEIKIDFLKQVKNIKIQNLQNKCSVNKNALIKINQLIQKKLPFIVNPERVDELDFYFIKMNSANNNVYYSNEMFKPIINQNIIKNGGLFKEYYPENKDIQFNDFLQASPFLFSPYNQNRSTFLTGLDYLADELLRPNSRDNAFFLVAKNKQNETVGTLSLYQSKSLKHMMKISGINIKKNVRGQGVAKKLYQKLSEVAALNEFIVFNSSYTQDGKLKLPKMKLEIASQNKNFFLLDGNCAEAFDDVKTGTLYNKYQTAIIDKLSTLELEQSFNYKKHLHAYQAGRDVILNAGSKPDEEIMREAYKKHDEAINAPFKSVKKKSKKMI